MSDRFWNWWMVPKGTTFWGLAIVSFLVLALLSSLVGWYDLIAIGVLGAIIWCGPYLDARQRERNKHGKDSQGPV